MSKQLIKVEGLVELENALLELPKATSRNILLRTLKKSGQVIADAEKSFAPKLTGQLALSPTVSTKLSGQQKSKHKKMSPVEVFVGPTPHAKSVQTEFGNRHQSAQPHLRPAWDGNWRNVLNDIRDTLSGEIEKARARLARKAAREAAKMKTGT